MTWLRGILWFLAAGTLSTQDVLQQGIALDRAGRYKEANALLTTAAHQRATSQVLNNLAVNLVHLERLPEAIEMFEQVLRADPQNASALFNVGSLYVATGNWDLAVTRLGALLKAVPEDSATQAKLAEAHRGLAGTLLRTGKLQESLPHFQKALELAPDDPSAYVGLSLALLRGNATDAATTLLKDAAIKFPADVRIATALGYGYEGLSQWSDAARWYRKALKLDSQSTVARVALGRVLQQSGETAQALQILREALEKDPQSAAACYELGNLLLLNDAQSEEGEALVKQASALSPGSAEPRYLLAKVAAGRGDLAEAKRWALAAVQADALFAAPHYLLANIHRKLDENASAEHELVLFRRMENSRRQKEDADLEQSLTHNSQTLK